MKTIPLPSWLTLPQTLTLAPAAKRHGLKGGMPASGDPHPDRLPGPPTAAAENYGEAGIAAKPITLSKNALLNLGRRFRQGTTVTVERGTVWLTGAPEDGDIILQAGQSLRLRGGRTVLLQALTDSTLRLMPPTGSPDE